MKEITILINFTTNYIDQNLQRERYHSRQPLSTYTPPEEVLETMVQGPVLANTKRSFTCQMRVPDIIAYNLEACSVIDIAYFLKVFFLLLKLDYNINLLQVNKINCSILFFSGKSKDFWLC